MKNSKFFQLAATLTLILVVAVIFPLVPQTPVKAQGDYTWPVEGRPGSFPFGGRNTYDYGGKHTGVDVIAPAGTQVVSFCTGQVVYYGNWPSEELVGTWRNTVWIKCEGEGWFGVTHLWDDNPHSMPYAEVKMGEKIGEVGPIAISGYGNVDHAHLMWTWDDPALVVSGGMALGEFNFCDIKALFEGEEVKCWSHNKGEEKAQGKTIASEPSTEPVAEPVREGDYIHKKCPNMDTSQSSETTYPKGIVVHHTVGSGGGNWFNAAIGTRHCGKSRPPYLLVIDIEGVIHQTAKFGSTTFHACCELAGNNHDYASIALVGNYVSQTPPKVMQEALVRAIAWLERKGVTPVVKGHREVASTQCPGDGIMAILPGLAEEARTGGLPLRPSTSSRGPEIPETPAKKETEILENWEWLKKNVSLLVKLGVIDEKQVDKMAKAIPLVLGGVITIILMVVYVIIDNLKMKIQARLGLVRVQVQFNRHSRLYFVATIALLVWWLATKDGIVLMTLKTVAGLWAFFLIEGRWVEFRVARKIKPLIPIDLREAIYGFGVVGTALAYLTGIIITLWVNPLPAMAVPPSKPLNPGSVNWQTPPLQELPPAFRAEVLALAEPVTQIAFEEGVPPEVPLVLWLKERGGHRINPQNGEGLCGFHNLVKSGEEYFRPGPISEGELLRQLRLCAREFKRRSSGISFETTDLNKLGPMYMRYNGNIDCHGQPFPSWKDHPYVMNGWDSSHQDMIARDGKGGCVALKIIGALPAHVRIGELLRGTASNP